MKSIKITILSLLLSLGIQLTGQEVQEKLDAAKASYEAGNLEDARFSLQQALQGINQAIGNEILNLLPDQLGEMNKVDAEDNVTGVSAGFAGLYVNRKYQGPNSDATVEIISDSPLLGSISSLLTMPVFMASDPNQKRIKIDSYKALLTRNDNDSIISYDVQMPFGSSMLTFNCNGIGDEKEVEGLLNTLPVSEIVKTAQ